MNVEIKLENNVSIKLDVKESIEAEIKKNIKLKKGNIILNMPKIDDVYRYLIDCSGSKLSMKCVKKGKREFKESNYKDKSVEIDKKYKTIVLILESPHEHEYGSNKEPIAPAQGQTGKGIEKNILVVINEIMNLQKDLLEKEKYRLIICNPIQYQTSLYMYHGMKLQDDYKTLRNQCWREIWRQQSIKDDFQNRMDLYNPSLIINACTSSLQDYITNYLKSNNYSNIYTTYHPSYWNGFNISEVK